MNIKIRKEIKGMDAYPAGRPISEVKRQYGLQEVIKLASNENPNGCSPKAKEAVSKLMEQFWMYPDPSTYELKRKIAGRWNVKPEQVFCGSGLDQLIRVICTAVIEPGDESVVGEVTFSRYADATLLAGGRVISVPMKDNGLDLEKMADAITPATKIIWFCNPNNPTGTMFTKNEFDHIIGRIPSNVIVVVDEAYYEFVTDNEFPDSLALLSKYPNMIVMRTFSKAYGLAGLRVGYGIGDSELVKYFNAIIGPFDVNIMAQAAAAAAIDDLEFVKMSRDLNNEGREYLYRELGSMGIPYVRTQSNFIAINVMEDDNRIFGELIKKGIIVKSGSSLKMPGYIRVSIGSMEQNKKFISALKGILKK